MAAVVLTELRRLKSPPGSRNLMTAVARADLRNLRLPPGSWDSHVHVIDEVGHSLAKLGFHC